MTPDELLATLAKDYETWPIQLAVRPELCHEIAACLERLAAAEAELVKLNERRDYLEVTTAGALHDLAAAEADRAEAVMLLHEGLLLPHHPVWETHVRIFLDRTHDEAAARRSQP